MMHIIRVFRTALTRSLLIISLAFMPISVFSATPLDINTATAAQLSAVMSGVGDKKAEAIITYRNGNGLFASIDDLSNVKGIGKALIKRNKDVIRVVLEETTASN